MTGSSGPDGEPRHAPAPGVGLLPNDGTSAEQLERLIRDITDVPVFPAAGLKLLATFKNPYYSGKQLGEIVVGDVGMSARVLRMANSAYYSITNKVTSVSHAVTLLGVREVERMALGICFLQMTPGGAAQEEGFTPADYIRHSMLVGRVAELVCAQTTFQLVGRGEAYAAGLLHDVGLLVLYRNHRVPFQEALRQARLRGIGYLHAELAVLGASHAALGAWLAQRWNLPQNLCEAIAYHHSTPPEGVMQPELIALLKLSERVVEQLGVGSAVEEPVGEPLDPLSLRVLAARGLPSDTRELVDSFCENFADEMEKVQAEVEAMMSGGGAAAPRHSVADLEREVADRPAPKAPSADPPASAMQRLRRWFKG